MPSRIGAVENPILHMPGKPVFIAGPSTIQAAMRLMGNRTLPLRAGRIL